MASGEDSLFITGWLLMVGPVVGPRGFVRQVNKGNLVFELLVRQKDCSARGPRSRDRSPEITGNCHAKDGFTGVYKGFIGVL